MSKKLGHNLKADNASWTFDNNVWKNFDNHILLDHTNLQHLTNNKLLVLYGLVEYHYIFLVIDQTFQKIVVKFHHHHQ